jgi:hypothetical protein
LEWFDEPPSFNDLCVRLNTKFGGDFTIKGRFDSGKTQTKYVLMPLRDPIHWSRYTRVLAGSNSPIAEVVVENGYMLEDDHHDNVGGDEEAVLFTSSQLYMDGQLTHEQLHSHPVGCISNDFDVREFDREEQEQAEENWFSHDDHDDDDGVMMMMMTTTTMIELPMRCRFMLQRPMFHFWCFMPC